MCFYNQAMLLLRDNLLIETCFYAAILAPWNLYLGPWNIYKCHRVRAARKEHDNINFWLVKWLLFRLMFASGVVKLLWMDEAWWNLTALNWHYESQVCRRINLILLPKAGESI